MLSEGRIKAVKVSVEVESGSSTIVVGDSDANSANTTDESVVPPSPITGAYLLCESIPDASLTELEKEVGCSLRDSKDQRINLKSETQSFAYSYTAPPSVTVSERTAIEAWDVQYRLQAESPAAVQQGFDSISFSLLATDLEGANHEFSSSPLDSQILAAAPVEIPATPVEIVPPVEVPPPPPPAEVPPPPEVPAPPAVNLDAMTIHLASRPNDCLEISVFSGFIPGISMVACNPSKSGDIITSKNSVFRLTEDQNLAAGNFCINGSGGVATCSGSSAAFTIEGTKIRVRDTNNCLSFGSSLKIEACVDGDAKQIWNLQSAP